METLFFTSNHLWCRKESNGDWTVGMTHYAVCLLDRITYVDFLCQCGNWIAIGQALISLESIKIAWELSAPFSGTLVQINDILRNKPTLLNTAPENAGWLCRIANITLPEERLSREEYNQNAERF